MNSPGNSISLLVLKAIGEALPFEDVTLEVPGVYLVGSEVGANLRLQVSEKVAPRHSMLIVDSANQKVLNLDPRFDTFLNGNRILDSRFHLGDRLQFGDAAFLVTSTNQSHIDQTTSIAVQSPNFESTNSKQTPIIPGFTDLKRIGMGDGCRL